MRLPIPQKYIPFAMAVCAIAVIYGLYIAIDAVWSGTIAADKHYHQQLIVRDEDPFRFYQSLIITVVLATAPGWLIYAMASQWRISKK